MIRTIPPQNMLRPVVAILWVFALASLSFGQSPTAFLTGVEPGRSLLGIPVDYPPFLSGTVSQWMAPATLQVAEVGNQDVPLQLPDIPCYLEVVGPVNHLWLGHRLELDEVATRQAAAGFIVMDTSSPRNTDFLRPDIAGASVVLRPHLTLQALFEKSLSPRLPELRAEMLKFWCSAPGKSPWIVEPRNAPPGRLLWVALSQGRIRSAQMDETILPPGSSVQVESRLATSLRTSLTGLAKKHACRFPLAAGPNLLAYPYPVPMRLGIDWGNAISGARGSTEVRNSDQISFWSQEARRFLTYGYFQPPGSSQGIWREIQSLGGSVPTWSPKPTRAVVFEPGEGWIFRKISADPQHTFSPPNY